MNWPQSLDEPASVNLPKILEEEASVKSGYFIYMIYSILIGPLGLTLSHVLAGKDQQNSPLLLKMANGFAISSAVLRCLGIIRWLVPMYGLAEVYTNPNTSEELRQAVEVMYDMLNDYAGSVGEILGVGFFASLWILTTAVVMIKDKTFPFWVGGLGIVAGILLGCTILEMFGVELGALLTANVTILHIWWLIIAGILAFRPNLVSGFEDPIRQEETGKGVLKEEDKET